ncbi:MAG: HNH endonuclease family protein [Vicinamibacteria bacterium]
MKTTKASYSIKRLVEAWESAELRRNPEYQRGASWSLAQQQALIDSAFRRCPLPPLFLEKKVTTGSLGGGQSVKYEVVDGQQRLLAFRGYYADQYPLLEARDKRLRLPTSLRSVPAPWARKKYGDLGSDLRAQLDEALVDVYELENVENPDQIRDLFIRLQSGTALTRQQIRDAWPGNVGPYVEHLAGKLSQRPAASLFRLIDKRGTRNEDDELNDEYVSDRQTCAQLLRLFLARERDPRAAPSVAASDLDALYHEHTDLDTGGESARRFEQCLDESTQVFELVAPISTIKAGGKSTRTKVRKLDAMATVLFFQDVLRNPHFRMDTIERARLAHGIGEFEKAVKPSGKGTSGVAIRDHYEKFREKASANVGITLDPKRLFDESQKDELFTHAAGICSICIQAVDPAEAEADHYPIPWRDGGPTTVDNGRLVHKRCHPRGRPASTEDGGF